MKEAVGCVEELNGTYNCWKFNKKVSEKQTSGERKLFELPWFGGLHKPYTFQGIGDNLALIRLSTKLKIIAEQTLNKKLNLVRINTNIQFFGQEGSFHKDAVDEGYWTFLVFLNINWLAEHGGEFLLLREDNSCYSSLPIPNRGILFKANLPHKGSAPNRFCGEPRITVACSYIENTK